MAGKYGQVHGAQPENKNKAIVAASYAVVLFAMVTAASAGGDKGEASADGGQGVVTSAAIKSVCSPTSYKKQCEHSLSKSAGADETDPKKLAQLTFEFAIDRLHVGLRRSTVLKKAAEDPRTKAALQCCGELLDLSIYELNASVAKFTDFEMMTMGHIVDDLKVWISAALTYQGTCLDGFENTTGDAAEGMAKALNSSMALTSNTLAIIDEISTVVKSFHFPWLTGRRLLSSEHKDGEYPGWVGGSQRRMLQGEPGEFKPDLKVAQDGSGTHKTIMEAINAVPIKKNVTFVIHVKAGVYAEQVEVPRDTWNLMMIGDGPSKTVVTGSLNFADGTGTYQSASFAVLGDQFSMRNMRVENTAGAVKHQAVALRVQSDRSVFYQCQFDGYQDTLYVHTKRQFYRDCTISGTVDFIFGDSPSVFQNCLLLVRKPLKKQTNMVTAQGRKEEKQPTAIVLQNCTIRADATLEPEKNSFRSYLGRPWKEFSRTIIMQSQIDDLIHPDGWLPWNDGDFALNTLFYSEIDNRGPGSDTSKRVKWKGIKKLELSDAAQFTVQELLQGDTWLPDTGVPFTPGLL